MKCRLVNICGCYQVLWFRQIQLWASSTQKGSIIGVLPRHANVPSENMQCNTLDTVCIRYSTVYFLPKPATGRASGREISFFVVGSSSSDLSSTTDISLIQQRSFRLENIIQYKAPLAIAKFIIMPSRILRTRTVLNVFLATSLCINPVVFDVEGVPHANLSNLYDRKLHVQSKLVIRD